MQEASLIPGTGDATAELHGCGSYHMGRGGRMAQKSGGSNRNDEIWKKLFTGKKKKKAIWKGRKVGNFGGNAGLVYRASFGGRRSQQFILCLEFGLD